MDNERARQPKLAFVTPWYGPDIPGGAEALARATVQRLQQAGFPVEVLTTTIEQLHADWDKNTHRPGLSRVNGVPVRRFAVEKRDRAAFDALNWRLMQGLSIAPQEEATFIGEMFRSPGLYEYIEEHSQEYLFFFVGYMFASTYFGAQICPSRSVIIPCLHDESYARLNIYRQVMTGVQGLVFNSAVEQTLAQRLFGRSEGQHRCVIGMGLNPEAGGNAQRFRRKYHIEAPFVLYVGRREPGKNTPLLLDYWQRYHETSAREVKLVLIGPGAVQLPPGAEDHVVDLGFVPAGDKLDAYAAAALLCQPSVHESFSIVLLESWRAGTPVLVHGHCAVTVDHCRRSNGGLYFSNEDEFAATLDFMLNRPALAQKMGRQGREYVLANFSWDVIVEKYRALIRALDPDPARGSNPATGRR